MKLNSLLFALVLIAGFLFETTVSAQNTGKNRQKQSVKAKIIVPESALLPNLTEEDVEIRMKQFTDWMDEVEKILNEIPPASFKKNIGAVQPILEGDTLIYLSALRDLALEPDLEEVTKCSRQYYKDVYNTAMGAYEVAQSMIIVVSNPAAMIQVNQGGVMVEKTAWPVFISRFLNIIANTREVIKRGPQKMPAAEWKKIVKGNRAERAKKYIEEMEKAIADGKMTLEQVNAKAYAKPSAAPAKKATPEKKKTKTKAKKAETK